MNRKIYQELIDMKDTTEVQVKSNVKAVMVLANLGCPSRELFSDFFHESRKSSPSPLIGEYLERQGVSSMGLRMGLQMKSLLLKGLRANDHKEAILGAVGQAYLDLCMAVSIAEYCKPRNGEELPYGRYISLAKQTVNELCSTAQKIQQALEGADTFFYDGEWLPLIKNKESGEDLGQVVQKRIDSAIAIISLWNANQIDFDSCYAEVEDKVEEIVYQNVMTKRSLDILPYIYCVQQNRSKFTETEISIATTMFSDCTKQAVTEFKKNPECADIDSTKMFIESNITKEVKNEIEKFNRAAQKKEAKIKEKEQKIKDQLAKDLIRKEEIEQVYQNTLADWVKENSAYLAIGYDIVQSENKDTLITSEPFDFLKSLIRDVSREVDLTKLDCPEQIDDKFSRWCIATVMPRRSK